MLNADGDAITFSPAMCEALRDDNSLSIIVGHEIAHNLVGHYDEAMAGNVGGMVAEWVIGTLTGFYLGGTAANAGAMACKQREVDYYGLCLSAYAGYDISAAPEMWWAFAHASNLSSLLIGDQ
jgi:beta-barrel assembly-enhancing protease